MDTQNPLDRSWRTILGQYANYVFAAVPLWNFFPKVTLSIERGNFLIKTAQNWKDVERVLRLRYEIFLREGLNLNFPLGLDVDRWDPIADHLMLLDRRNDRVVGTYRLISSCFSNTLNKHLSFH